MTLKHDWRRWGQRAAASALLLAPVAAWAAEGEGAAEGGGGGILGSLGLDPKTLAVQVFAFIILYILFKAFLWKPILGLLETRQEEVAGIYSQAESSRAAAEAARKDYEVRMAKADEESRERIATALAQANAMKDEIVNSAREQADRIILSGRENVRREMEKAQVQIRDTAAKMAVDVAGRIIQREMDPAAQRALVDQFIDGAGAGRTQ
jgi:F-type H+-transporting ATPase subunit b